jgi:hypothetical protein
LEVGFVAAGREEEDKEEEEAACCSSASGKEMEDLTDMEDEAVADELRARSETPKASSKPSIDITLSGRAVGRGEGRAEPAIEREPWLLLLLLSPFESIRNELAAAGDEVDVRSLRGRRGERMGNKGGEDGGGEGWRTKLAGTEALDPAWGSPSACRSSTATAMAAGCTEHSPWMSPAIAMVLADDTETDRQEDRERDERGQWSLSHVSDFPLDTPGRLAQR